MTRTIRVLAVAGATLVGAAMAPAVASAESSFGSSGAAGSHAASSEEQGVIAYDTLGMNQASGLSPLSVQLLGSLGGFLPNPGGGGHQPPTGVDPKADIFFTSCTDGLAEGFVRYDNNDSNEAVEFSLVVNGTTVDSQSVPAESEVDGVEFSGVVIGTFVTVIANGEEIESLDALPCEV